MKYEVCYFFLWKCQWPSKNVKFSAYLEIWGFFTKFSTGKDRSKWKYVLGFFTVYIQVVQLALAPPPPPRSTKWEIFRVKNMRLATCFYEFSFSSISYWLLVFLQTSCQLYIFYKKNSHSAIRGEGAGGARIDWSRCTLF